jgi:uncharacterized protein YjiS (DUF1127 family)
MTARSCITVQGTLAEHDAGQRHAAGLPTAIAPLLAALRLTWERWSSHRRLSQSIAHLDNRLLADIGLSPEDLSFAERVARRRAVDFGTWPDSKGDHGTDWQ